MDDSAIHSCAYCGEPNEVDVDLSAGRRQTDVEDGQVYCRPNVLAVEFSEDARVGLSATPAR